MVNIIHKPTKVIMEYYGYTLYTGQRCKTLGTTNFEPRTLAPFGQKQSCHPLLIEYGFVKWHGPYVTHVWPQVRYCR
jgi:hypothetical protein